MREAVKEELSVYVALLDEGVDVWRPVAAQHVHGDEYELCGTVPDEEVWQFQPGEVVRCETRRFSDGTSGLVAVGRARPDA
jgi:hypothetical protein